MIPPNLTAATKLAVYRASGLVHWPNWDTRPGKLNGRSRDAAAARSNRLNAGSRPVVVVGRSRKPTLKPTEAAVRLLASDGSYAAGAEI
jgi:hypothetical protein